MPEAQRLFLQSARRLLRRASLSIPAEIYSSPDLAGLVYEIAASDHTMHVIAGAPANGDSGDGGLATAAGIEGPAETCISATRGIDVVDAFRVRSFPVGGNIATTAGDGLPNYFGDNGPAISAGLDLPAAVVSDTQGNIYVADQTNRRVRRIDAITGVITTVAGNGAFGGLETADPRPRHF
jgi:hypothetical protein